VGDAAPPTVAEIDARLEFIGDSIDYADGSEAAVLHALTISHDRSSTSDELETFIRDWPTRYHLSRSRTNLLRALRFRPGTDVIEFGTGTGVLARYLGERGARVIGVEGSRDRARAAALRCYDLPDVRILVGKAGDLSPEYRCDVALCVGVYEYIASKSDADGASFLARVREHVRPGGVLILAIENQIGLKYLLGAPEDHLGTSWAGVAGYPPRSVARTFTRRRLAEDLERSGFPAQRWLFPFPDYKLPSTILAEEAYRHADGVRLVDSFLRWPSDLNISARTQVADERRVQQVFGEAGLGPDVANSFLVVASDHPTGLRRFSNPTVLAWWFGGNRLARWRVMQRLCTVGGTNRTPHFGVVGCRSSLLPPVDGWLRQRIRSRRRYHPGPTLEQVALEALQFGANELAVVLCEWKAWLERQQSSAPADHHCHPYAAAAGTQALPASYLDVGLANFTRDGSGGLRYFDDEWETDAPLDATLVTLRALWWFAVELVQRHVLQNSDAGETVDAVALWLCARCGLTVPSDALDRLYAAEADFQWRVSGGNVEGMLEALRTLGALRPSARFVESLAQARGTADASLAHATTDADRAQAAALEAARRLAAAEAREAAATTALNEAQHLLQQANDRVADREARWHASDAALAEIKASRSWRWSAPIRFVGRLARRVGGRLSP